MRLLKTKLSKALSHDKWLKTSLVPEGMHNREINEVGSKSRTKTNKTGTVDETQTLTGARTRTPNHNTILQRPHLHMLMYRSRWTSIIPELRQGEDDP